MPDLVSEAYSVSGNLSFHCIGKQKLGLFRDQNGPKVVNICVGRPGEN
jgi:hypothetical protein